MKATKKMLFGLTAALASCIAATLLLTFAGRGEAAAGRTPIYYFTNYAAPEELLLASVENDTGSVALAAANGAYYVSGNVHLEADGREVANFFNTVYRLPMKRLLEGADASDPQYGLTEPRAEILLQDTKQNGVLFLVGSATPDGEGCYACLSGDTRVFVMDRAYAQLFLDRVDRFFDRSLYPSLEGDGVCSLCSVTVQREGKTVYTLRLDSASQDGGTAVFSMEEPYSLVLGINQARDEILTPLRELEGTEIVPKPEDLSVYALADRSNCFTLTYQDGSAAVIRVGRQEGSGTYVLREDTGLVMLAPTANLSFFHDTALQVVGQNLVDIPMGNLISLRIGDRVYQLSGTPPALCVTLDGAEQPLGEFQNGVYTALNRITLQGEWNGAGQGELLIEAAVQAGYAGGSAQTTAYAFYVLEGRRCGVAVNGQPAFLCSQSAVQRLIDAAG